MTLTKFLRTSAAALGALAVASVGQANAADIYTGGYKEAPVNVPPPFWTGFYIGGHIGAAWENFSFQRHEFDDFGPCYSCYAAGTWGYSPGWFNNNQTSGADAFGGAQLGYNYQFSPAWVAGIEVDLGGMSLNHAIRSHTSTDYTYTPAGSSTTYDMGGTPAFLDGESQGGFYGDITGRLGWTWGPAMIYAKGGFAWLNANLNMRESVYDTYGTFCGGGWCEFSHSSNDTLTGWTLGGGVEWKVSPSWSIKAEYLHFDFTNFNNACCNDNLAQAAAAAGYTYNNFNNHADLQIDTVKLGFNYFWNPAPPAPLK